MCTPPIKHLRIEIDLLQALEEQEEKLDADIERLERLEEDDLERMRRNRLAQLKKVHKQKEEWAAKVGVGNVTI